MNIILSARGKAFDIQRLRAEDVNASLDRIVSDLRLRKAAWEAYLIDLANDVDPSTSLALSLLADYDPANQTDFLRRDGTWAVPPQPTGFVPDIVSRAWAMGLADIGGTRDVGLVMSFSGAGTAQQTDSDGVWKRVKTGAATTNTADVSTNNVFRVEHDPKVQFYLKTSSDITNLRYWIGMFSAGPTDSDTNTGKCLAFRYSTGTDAGFVTLNRDGSAQTVTAGSTAIAASTRYGFEINVSGDGQTATFSINGVVVDTMTIPAGCLGSNMYLDAFVSTKENVAKFFDFRNLYYERD